MASAEELAFLYESMTIEQELVDAKAARADGVDGADARVTAAKLAAREHRRYWRQIRALIGGEGPAPDAIAASVTSSGATPEEG